MQWTCQREGQGPLWWRIGHSEHWYRPETLPEELAADYLRAHPHDSESVLVLTWWKSWGTVGRQVRVEPSEMLVG
jgi:hypothetical protein